MTLFKTAAIAALTLAVSASIATAQDAHSGHAGGHQPAGASGPSAGEIQLPPICLTAGDQRMGGMDEMNRQMMIGMMAEDIDVAFVCGMIPHHQSAVNMAKAQLEHGDDTWARELAKSVIENQEQEIADMFAWLEERAADEIAD
jgi:hypothetical protein